MGGKEKGKLRRQEIEEQVARIAEIAEQKRSLRAEENEDRWGKLAHEVMLEAKEEGLSTALVFGFFLKEAREKAGLSQEELGSKVEELEIGKRVSGSLICRFERGERLGEQFASKRVLSVVAALRAPGDVFCALMEHYKHVWPKTTTLLLKTFGEHCLHLSLEAGIVPLDAARYSHTLKGE